MGQDGRQADYRRRRAERLGQVDHLHATRHQVGDQLRQRCHPCPRRRVLHHLSVSRNQRWNSKRFSKCQLGRRSSSPRRRLSRRSSSIAALHGPANASTKPSSVRTVHVRGIACTAAMPRDRRSTSPSEPADRQQAFVDEHDVDEIARPAPASPPRFIRWTRPCRTTTRASGRDSDPEPHRRGETIAC